MADLFDRADEALVSLETRTRYDERNRLALLAVHAFIGIIVGWKICQAGPPEAWVIQFGPDADLFLVAPAFLGGILLLLGLAWNRNIILEALGMLGILVWDFLMLYVLQKHGTTGYAPWVYVGMASLMTIHVYTLGHYLWAQKRAQR